ncbi:MAG: hypothetical protein ER33_07205 [Cyanobium sp. CACIAM 14]|nr:MAG: hypothetical protein ER33_07205 [Cyanobium sp. CACIAM 14]
MTSTQRTVDLALRLAAMAALGVWCFLVIRPFLPILAFATILAIGLDPVHLWLSRLLGQRSTLAASLLGLAGIGVILGPVAYLGVSLFDDVRALARQVSHGSLSLPPVPEWLSGLPLIGASITELWRSARSDLLHLLERFAPQLEHAGKFLLGWGADTGVATLQMIVAMLIAAAFMCNAAPLRRRLGVVVRRLAPSEADRLIALATATLQNVIRGVIGVAVVQSGLIGIALVVAQVPWAGLLALVCFILCLVQIGPVLVVVPVLIYAWLTMHKGIALLLSVWLVLATLSDNVLKPIWMARGLPVPLVVVYLGVIGGTLSFGLLGLFTGPVVLALGYEMLRLWTRDQDSTGEVPSPP